MLSPRCFLPEKVMTVVCCPQFQYPAYFYTEVDKQSVILGLPNDDVPSEKELSDIYGAFEEWYVQERGKNITFHNMYPRSHIRSEYAASFIAESCKMAAYPGLELLARLLGDYERICFQTQYATINYDPFRDPHLSVEGGLERFRLSEKLRNELSNSAIDQCFDFGLLFWQNDDMQKTPTRSDVEDEGGFAHIINATPIINCLHRGFECWDYVKKMRDLYALFLCWRRIVWDDESAVEMLRKMDMRPYRLIDVEYLKLFICQQSYDCQCRMSIGFVNGGPVRRILVDSPMDAAFYTMVDIIAGGKPALEGHTLDFCSLCGKQYIKHRSNATLCPVCRTPYAKVKASRDRKKGVSKNVNKEK